VAAVALAMLKVTNDPSLGNYWLFYTPAERQAVTWADREISGQLVWTDISNRLENILVFWEGYNWTPTNTYQNGPNYYYPPYGVISRLTQLQAERAGQVFPYTTADHQLVYDDGDVQIYFRRAQTLYQP